MNIFWLSQYSFKVSNSKQKYQNQYIASPTEKKYNPNFSFFLKEIKELPWLVIIIILDGFLHGNI
jgi:hypothetical protein